MTLYVPASALNPDLDVSQYAHTSWKIRDGFVKGEIDSMAQTQDGYLWLGTEFGLYRFDGIRAIPWKPEGQHLPPGSIRSLLVTRDGTLWIGADGLASFRNGKATEYPDLAQFYIFSLLEDHEGNVWVGAGGLPFGRLCRIHDGIVQCYGADGKFGRIVRGLFEDSAGNLWAGVLDGVWKWNPGHPRYFHLAGLPNGIDGVIEDRDGALIIGGGEKLYRFLNGKAEAFPLPGNLTGFSIKQILRDRDGALWIATRNGILHVHEGRTDALSAGDSLSGDDVLSIFEDQEGNVWTSTVEGLDRFHDLAISRLTVKQGLSSNVVDSIVADSDGSVWLGTLAGLNQVDRGQVRSLPGHGGRKDELNGDEPHPLLQDSHGRMWFGSLRGLGHLEDGRLSSVPGVPGGNFLSMAQDTAGYLWAVNEEVGLFRISLRNDVLKVAWADLGRKDHASVLAADVRRGGLWIGFFQGGIAYLSDGRIRESYATADGLGAGRVSAFLFDSDGAFWISTEGGGLSRLKNNRLITLTTKNGLPCDTVHWAAEEDDHSLWLYTACGLVRIARSELDSWVAAADKEQNTNRTVQVSIYDISDGVRSVAISGHYLPQVAKTPDGRLWFSSWDGVSVIDPHHLPFNAIPPPVHIERIVADGKEYENSNGLPLPARVQHVDIDYTALSLVAPEKNRFRFKLEGYDSDWRDVGNRRQAFYTNLEPRKYRFRVIACNNSGVWNETGASLEFSIAPAYYQTHWFRALCVAAFLALLWALYQRRLQVMRRQYAVGLEATVGERMRVARELHDTLLQSFQGAVYQFQAARKLLLHKSDNAPVVMEEAILAAEEAIEEGRVAIHDLRPAPVGLRELPELLDATGRELADTHQMNGHAPSYRVIVEGAQRDLSPILQDEVYRISREVIRNAFTHAAANHIEAEIYYDNDQLRLRIRDDGKGMDRRILEAGHSGHFGIPGIRERAQRIGAKLDFWSEEGAGTEVQISIPASMAYQKPDGARRFWLFRAAKRS